MQPIAAVQTEYSPISRNAEIALLAATRELGIGFVAFSPVARGLLAGAIRSDDYPPGDIRKSFPRYVEPQRSHNLRLVDRFNALAAEAGLTPAQLSIGWDVARDEHIVAIPARPTSPTWRRTWRSARSRPIATDLVAAVDAIFPPNVL